MARSDLVRPAEQLSLVFLHVADFITDVPDLTQDELLNLRCHLYQRLQRLFLVLLLLVLCIRSCRLQIAFMQQVHVAADDEIGV